MPQLTLEQRVDRLEDLMAEVLRAQARTQAQLDQLAREMREFKEEMRAFKDEMRLFKQEMLDFKDEMRAFKDEMRLFKQEMLDFKDEMRRTIAKMNKQWGDLANKMGTLAEDIVAPGIPAILRQVVGCSEVDSLAVRVRRRLPDGTEHEFDVVATCDDYALINETKSKLTVEHVKEFVAFLRRVREFFPEFQGKHIIGAVASLYVEPTVTVFAERQGLLVIGLGEENLVVLNSPDFTPKAF